MISLLISFAVLILGYAVYGRVVEKVFGPDDRQTPAVAVNDGVDCVPLKTERAFLIQLLNIAGNGPIFGALMGSVFGPVVFLWIVFGSILGGAVHDYMSGMISARHGGASIAELSGVYLGKGAMWFMRVFSVILLVLCGTVFVTSPAGLLDKLTPGWMSGTFWTVVILIYYLAATLLPIDKLISRLYPVFGVLLITMAAAVVGGGLTWFATVNTNGFQIIWRYFSWSNQTLAMFALWVATAYLAQRGKKPLCSLITAIPAAFMSAVSVTYILTASEGFRLSTRIAYPIGMAAALTLFVTCCVLLRRRKTTIQKM